MTLSDDIARYLVAHDPVAPAIRRRACEGIADVVGVMLGGRRESIVRTLQAMAAPADAGDAASLLIGGGMARAVDAALVNGTAAHVLAMDDVVGPLHPSASLLPALLAEAEAIDATGGELVDAYVAGFEVLVALSELEPDSLHDGGWHPTGVLGPIGAAAAVAHLKRLSSEECVHALGIAASMTGGVQANFGTQTKAMHLGRVASAGIWAARLAERGVTSSSAALDGPKGLLRTVSPKGRVEPTRRLSFDSTHPRLGTTGISFKKYPVCYTTHRVVDAAIRLASMHRLDPARVRRIDVRIGRRQAAMAHFGVPTTLFEAKYSVPFAVAAGLIARAAGLAQLDMAFIASPTVRRLIEATELEPTDTAQAGEPVFAHADRVRLTLDDGAVLDSGEVVHAVGHAALPWSADDHRRKFFDCAASTGFVGAEALYGKLMDLDRLDRVQRLVMDTRAPVIATA